MAETEKGLVFFKEYGWVLRTGRGSLGLKDDLYCLKGSLMTTRNGSRIFEIAREICIL